MDRIWNSEHPTSNFTNFRFNVHWKNALLWKWLLQFIERGRGASNADFESHKLDHNLKKGVTREWPKKHRNFAGKSKYQVLYQLITVTVVLRSSSMWSKEQFWMRRDYHCLQCTEEATQPTVGSKKQIFSTSVQSLSLNLVT